MRKSLILFLLAGAATPAVAAQGTSSSDRPRAERAERAERSERAERAERVRAERPRAERPARPERSDTTAQTRSAERPEGRSGERPAPGGNTSGGGFSDQAQAPAPRTRETGDSVRDWRMRERQRADSPSAVEERNRRRSETPSGEGLVEQARPLPRVLDRERPRARPEGGFADSNEISRQPGRVISRTPRPGTEPPPPPTATAAVAQPARQWTTGWRNDRRYNWYNYRHRNPARFRIGFYFDPFGWHYHRFGIGWRLWPSYYSSRFWLHDPWHWRLPPAYGPYRWVRYWDDAVLVNIYTGQVVDVIYDFFW